MSKSENFTKALYLDKFIKEYGTSMNFKAAKPLLKEKGIDVSKRTYNFRVLSYRREEAETRKQEEIFQEQ
ncbi:MAG: hypothetical protein WA139_00035 [Candidatus Aenigmatarchaeota archaeon]